MSRSNTTLTVSLCTSLAVHGAVLTLIAWWVARHAPPVRLAAQARALDLAPPIVPPPEQPLPQSPPAPSPPPPPQAPQPEADDFSKAMQLLKDDSGEADGKGTANRSTPGDRPMQAMQGLEQANLTRNQQALTPDQTPPTATPGRPGSKSWDEAAIPRLAPPGPPPAFGVPEAPVTPRVAEATPEPAPRPLPAVAMRDPNQPGPAQQPAAAVASLGTAQGQVGAAPSATPAAVQQSSGAAALSSDTDSAPFAHAPSVQFENGRLDARQGRRVRTTHISFGLAAAADAAALPDPTVQLGVSVDAGGNVRNVVVLRSSGSPNIDLPCQRSVYLWWFEPRKDGQGHPLPELWVVNILP